MEKFDLDKWLIERYSPLTLERIKKAYFDYDDVIEILNEALRQPPVSDSLPPDKICRVQRIVNMARLETGLSEDEVVRYMIYLLKGKEIEKRGGNDR
jgi:hypothetical protein